MSKNKITKFTDNPYFKECEFVCKCPKCKEVFISDELITKLTEARKIANIPFIITSGCRCPEHNSKVTKATNSDHLADHNHLCCGVDIQCNNDRNRYVMITSLLKAGINRIGLAKTFIHAGIDSRNPGQLIWFY